MIFKRTKTEDLVAIEYSDKFVVIDKTKLLEGKPARTKSYVIEIIDEEDSNETSDEESTDEKEKVYRFIRAKNFRTIINGTRNLDMSIPVIGVAVFRSSGK